MTQSIESQAKPEGFEVMSRVGAATGNASLSEREEGNPSSKDLVGEVTRVAPVPASGRQNI